MVPDFETVSSVVRGERRGRECRFSETAVPEALRRLTPPQGDKQFRVDAECAFELRSILADGEPYLRAFASLRVEVMVLEHQRIEPAVRLPPLAYSSPLRGERGEGGNRTRDRGFADLGLTTWLPRRKEGERADRLRAGDCVSMGIDWVRGACGDDGGISQGVSLEGLEAGDFLPDFSGEAVGEVFDFVHGGDDG